jgi:large subunit ribosomal protein L5
MPKEEQKEAKQVKPVSEKKTKSETAPKGGKVEKKAAATAVQVRVAPRLKEVYAKNIVPSMMKEFNYTSVMQVPKLEKIVLNMGVGGGDKDQKLMDNSVRDMGLITGQKPVVTLAKKAISNFRLRKGMRVGCKVTLRGEQMLHFFDKLVNVVLPRMRDFQGLSAKSFDGHGNYSLGIKEQLVFPEIVYDQVDKIRGMDIIICTTALSDEEARVFLKSMGLPLQAK